MNILFVTSMLPHPNFRGSGGQDLAHYIEALSRKHEVSLIAFVRTGQSEAVDHMQSVCKQVVAVPYDTDSFLQRLWRAGWRVLLPKVYGRNVSIRLAAALRGLVSENQFHVVVIEGTMALYAWILPQEKRIIDEIDVYSRVAHQEYKSKRHLFRRLLAWFEWKRTKAAELMALRSCDGVIVRSKDDRNWLEKKRIDSEIAVISPWFEGLSEMLSIEAKRPDGNKILFMGAMKNPKNKAAVLFFAKEIFPWIKGAISDAIFLVVGDAPSQIVRDLGDDSGIIVTGEVGSLKPYYEQCAVNVVPLLIGGGIIVKTLNGMAAGRPTIATPQGLSGISAQPGRELLVVPADPVKIAEAVIRVLTDDELWLSLAEHGKQFVRRQYNWSETVAELESYCLRVAGN
jgi:glycosyltransferase involved in cell wall biosynthesis